MIRIRTICSRCNSECYSAMNQIVRNGRPAWTLSTNCPGCGHSEEADGRGLLPSDLRDKVTSEEGLFELAIEANQPTAAAAKQLQAMLGLSLAEVALIKKHIPGPILSGTNFEMEWVGENLRTQDVKVCVRARHEGAYGAVDIAQFGKFLSEAR